MTLQLSQAGKACVTLILSILALAWSADAQADMLSRLSDGQHVLMIRHADAPGYGDPPGYRLDQCATQRNLGELGRRQARDIGQWLISQGITSARVLSSPWCRCIDTATLLDKGPVSVAAELGSFFDDMQQQATRTRSLETLVNTRLKAEPKMPLILVTHHVNIQAFTGRPVNSGDMVMVRVDDKGRYVSHTLYPSPKL